MRAKTMRTRPTTRPVAANTATMPTAMIIFSRRLMPCLYVGRRGGGRCFANATFCRGVDIYLPGVRLREIGRAKRHDIETQSIAAIRGRRVLAGAFRRRDDGPNALPDPVGRGQCIARRRGTGRVPFLLGTGERRDRAG